MSRFLEIEIDRALVRKYSGYVRVSSLKGDIPEW